MVSVEPNNVDAFTLESYPWTSVFKANRKLSIRAEFDRELRRFKDRRPMPSVGRIISLCGMLSGFHMGGDNSTSLTIDIHEISFLSTVPQTTSLGNGKLTAMFSFCTNGIRTVPTSPTPSTPHRGLRYGMRARGISASPGNRGKGPSLPQEASLSASGSVVLPAMQEIPRTPSAHENLPSVPSTPPNLVSASPEQTRNLRKRRKRNGEDGYMNVIAGEGGSGSSLSTESTLSESLQSSESIRDDDIA